MKTHLCILFLVVLAMPAIAATRTAGLTTPGSPIPPEGGLLRLGVTHDLAGDEDFIRCGVSDPATNYAWFGTSTSPGQVIKVAFDGPNQAPRRVASLMLDSGEDSLFTAVIDTNAGYAYFGTFTSPARVIKVALGDGDEPPRRIGAVTLGLGENQLMSSVIDPAGGYAWFGTRTSPGRVVKVALGAGPNAPTRVGAITLSFGENILRSAVIDPTAGYAWFGTFSVPGRVVKVGLGAGNAFPTRVGALTLNSGEDKLTSAVIDAAAGQAWFGTYTWPGRVVKVDLGSGDAAPTRLGAVTLNPGENSLACAAVTAAAPGHAFFGCDNFPGVVVKVNLGSGTAPPTRVGAVTLPSGEDSLVSAADVGSAMFFGANTQPGQVIQIRAGGTGQPPVREGTLTLLRGENDLQSSVIDPVAGYGWFGTATFPGQIIKVKLGGPGQPPRRVAALTLAPDEGRPICAVADLANGHAWFGTDTSPGHVVKIALGAGDAPPVRLGAVTLNSDERSLRSAVIDLAHDYAYFGTAVQPPGKVIKVALGTGDNPPTRVGAVTLNADEWDLQSAVLDAAGTHALFGTGQYLAEQTGAGKVLKIVLGSGSNPPTRADALALPAGEGTLHSVVADPAGGYAWFGAGGPFFANPEIIKVAFGADNAPSRRVGAVALNTNAAPIDAAAIDGVAGYAIFGSAAAPSQVIKIALGDGEAPPAVVGSIELPPDENSVHTGGGDPATGLAWFGTSTQPGRVVSVSYSQKGFIKATQITLPEAGDIVAVHFYSHHAAGQVRLALYSHSGTTRQLEWQSGLITNTVQDGWIDVPIAAGSPSTLKLSAGVYDLAWQVDTTADVPSYVGGAMGDGFRVPAAFGPFPAQLAEGANGWTTTSETWASHISYDVERPRFIEIRRTNDIVTLKWTSNPGTTYQVQRADTLPPSAWLDAGLPVQATNTVTIWSESGTNGVHTRFYRLKLP